MRLYRNPKSVRASGDEEQVEKGHRTDIHKQPGSVMETTGSTLGRVVYHSTFTVTDKELQIPTRSSLKRASEEDPQDQNKRGKAQPPSKP